MNIVYQIALFGTLIILTLIIMSIVFGAIMAGTAIPISILGLMFITYIWVLAHDMRKSDKF